MRYLLGLILLISVSASAQYSPTAAKTRFVNGIGLGTKDTLSMNAADTVAMIVGRDSLVYFRYKGYWKPLAYNSSLTGYVPYVGATADVDLDTHILNAQALHAKGTAGNGHVGLKHQSAAVTGTANESNIYANTSGDMSWLNGNHYLSVFATSANTAARTYTFPNASGTVILSGDTATMLLPYLRSANFGLIKNLQSISADTSVLATRLRVQKGIDSLGAAKQTALNGTGFVKASGTTISYDNSTYLTTSAAASTYVPYSGATTNVNLGAYNLAATRVNIGGAVDNSQFALNVNSESNFSNSIHIKSAHQSIFYDATNTTYWQQYNSSNILTFAYNGSDKITFNTGGGITSPSEIVVKKNGSNSVGSGGYFSLINTASTDGWFLQLNASNGFDYWALVSGSFNKVYNITNTGMINTTSRLNVNGATDDGSTALNVSGAGRFSGRLFADANINFSGFISPNANVGYGVKSSDGVVLQEWYNGATYNYGTFVNTGTVTFQSLAGTGSRIVVVDASGTLSATTAAATSGTYTPTITLVTNAASSTARVCQYMRVGSVVTVSGYVTVTATTPAASSRIYMSLPISSSFTSTAQAGGAGGVPGGANIGTVIFANSTSTTVSMDFLPVSGATDYWFSYTYQIL